MENRYAFQKVAKAEDGEIIASFQSDAKPFDLRDPQSIIDAMDREAILYDEAIHQEMGNVPYSWGNVELVNAAR